MSDVTRILSLGAGVQSSTMALMAARGEIDMPAAAVFADTGWEPRKVYEWLDWLEKQLPYPVYRVRNGSLRDSIMNKQSSTGGRFASIPWFTIGPDGKPGMGRRQCTSEHKLLPLRREMRRLLGYEKGARIPPNSCEALIGISTDEALRMKPSTDKWIKNRWPLIEKGMSRNDCLRWMERNGYPKPGKSSCIGCPYHSDDEWRAIKADPEAWADALEVDKIIREPVRGFRGRQFMHADRVPLDKVDLLTPRERGQIDAFNNECEGMCGV